MLATSHGMHMEVACSHHMACIWRWHARKHGGLLSCEGQQQPMPHAGMKQQSTMLANLPEARRYAVGLGTNDDNKPQHNLNFTLTLTLSITLTPHSLRSDRY